MKFPVIFRAEALRYKHSLLLQMLVVFAMTLAALAGTIAFRSLIAPSYFLPFIGVSAAAAWIYGLPAGLFAAVWGAALVHFFFLSPPGSLFPSSASNVFRLCVFLILAVLICALIELLARGRTRLVAALSAVADGLILVDDAGLVTFANPAALSLLGINDRELIGKNASGIVTLKEAGSGAEIPVDVARVMRDGALVPPSGPAMLVTRGGDGPWVEVNAAPVRDARGGVSGCVIVMRDVTKPRQLQTQLSQSEKMEAVARLAGGVAGDFNNLLTVITGYGEMIRSDLSPGDPLRRFTEEILFSAERAAGLARQLLVFSRGQSGQMRLLNLNELFAGMETMLKRLVGENVEIVFLPGPAVGRVSADPAQIEQMIVNLAMNSRDAMPGGGRFVIETNIVEVSELPSSKRAGVEPGSYVLVAVSDTGTGMDDNTRARLFEPFFTTKVQGKGAGLGLSIVYGIVQQSKGHISVYSQPGAGTIFEIYFPRVKETADPVHRTKGRGPRGSETVLVAEDEDGVRKLVMAVLATHGYTVLEAPNGQDALEVFEAHRGSVDLVISDVVMPKLNGYDFVHQVSQRDPDVKVLYMSGFRESHLTAPASERQRPFLGKPFTPNMLLARVREVLDDMGYKEN